MKHDLIIDWQQECGDYHQGFAECRRCDDSYGYLCCNKWFLEEECPSGQLELLDTNLQLLV